MFNSPAGGSGQLFPSPAKGHTNEGLSGEQSSDAQTLINSALSGYYPRGTVDALLAGKQPTITEGGLAQSKVTNLVADLGAKALQADLVSGLAGKEPTITEGSLARAKFKISPVTLQQRSAPSSWQMPLPPKSLPSQRAA